MYAFVDVQNYQKVVVTDANEGIIKAKDNYLKNININDDIELIENTIIIKTINTALIDGNTYYFIEDSNNNRYKASIKVNEDTLPFINIGSTLKITYSKNNTINEIIEIE